MEQRHKTRSYWRKRFCYTRFNSKVAIQFTESFHHLLWKIKSSPSGLALTKLLIILILLTHDCQLSSIFLLIDFSSSQIRSFHYLSSHHPGLSLLTTPTAFFIKPLQCFKFIFNKIKIYSQLLCSLYLFLESK